MKIEINARGIWFISDHTSLHFDREWVKTNMAELLKLADFITTTEQDMTMEEETSPDDRTWCSICTRFVRGKYCNTCGCMVKG